MSEKPDWKKKGEEYARDAVSGSPELDRVALRLAYLAGVRAGLEAAAACAARDTFYVADEIHALLPE